MRLGKRADTTKKRCQLSNKHRYVIVSLRSGLRNDGGAPRFINISQTNKILFLQFDLFLLHFVIKFFYNFNISKSLQFQKPKIHSHSERCMSNKPFKVRMCTTQLFCKFYVEYSNETNATSFVEIFKNKILKIDCNAHAPLT